MWNLSFTPPAPIQARVLTRLPDAFRASRRTEWVELERMKTFRDYLLGGGHKMRGSAFGAVPAVGVAQHGFAHPPAE